MNWQQFWDRQANLHQQPHAQVARTGTGILNSDNSTLTNTICDHIIQLLDLQPTDRLLDVCCGNGILTHRLAQFCKSVTAVDISAQQLKIAQKNYSQENIEYSQVDVMALSNHLKTSFNKINLYFSFQYLDSYKKGAVAIAEMLKLLNPGGIILLGDVPDHEFLSVFYPDPKIRFKYFLSRISGRDQMGKFWKKAELEKIVSQHQAIVQRLKQPEKLPYSHYRVDYLIRKTPNIAE